MSLNVDDLINRRADNRWDRTAVGDLLERMTWSTPDKTAVVGWPGAYATPEFERLSYAQANSAANRMANALRGRGLDRGDVVMMFCDNSVEAWLTKFAVAKAGLTVAPVNTMMAPDAVGELIERVEPKLAVVDGNQLPRVAELFGARGVTALVTIPFGDQIAGVPFADFLAGQPDSEPDVTIHGDDIWQILFTSGTTATPKGAMHSHNTTYFAGYSFALSHTRGLRFESDLVLCSFLPLIYHVGDEAFNVPVQLCGGTLILGRTPDPEQLIRSIERERVTALWAGSPAMLGAVSAALDAHPGIDTSSLRTATYGWAALPPTVLDALKRRCAHEFTAFAIFGQTESVSCHRFWPDQWAQLYARTAPKDNYVGHPSPILASTVLDPFGDEPAPGEPGEAVYRSPAVTAGYYRDERATEEAFRGGWFHSGDSCVVGEHGLRIMVDRFKDIVKSGGENVSSLRVESVLVQHPGVARAAVIGLPHPRWQEAVTAVVVRAPGPTVSAADLISYCRERLAGFETPKHVEFVDALPDTVGGKILKYQLRQQFSDLYRTVSG